MRTAKRALARLTHAARSCFGLRRQALSAFASFCARVAPLLFARLGTTLDGADGTTLPAPENVALAGAP